MVIYQDTFHALKEGLETHVFYMGSQEVVR